MFKLKNKFKTIIKYLINKRSGFTLVELMIVVLVIAIVLGMGFTLFLFGVSSQQIGGEQTDVQQNARLVANFISKELRMAEKGTILDKYDADLSPESLKTFVENDLDYRYPEEGEEEEYYIYIIYENKDTVYYQEVDGTEQPAVLLEGISRNIDFDLDFERSAEKKNILNIKLSATDKISGRNYDLKTEVLALNLDSFDEHEGTNNGNAGPAIVYQIPAPPEPSIVRFTINPRTQIYTADDMEDIKVGVLTDRVDDDEAVTAEVWQRGGENPIPITLAPDEPKINDNKCVFSIKLPDFPDEGLYFGDNYYVKVDIDAVGSSSRYFYIEPGFEIEVDEFPSSEHWGDVTITTLGVPHETLVDVELFYYDDTDEEVQVVFEPQSVGPGYYEDDDLLIEEGDDKKGELSFRINEDYIGEDIKEEDLFLRATIGNTTREAGFSLFIIEEINIEDDGHDDILVEVVTSGDISDDYEEAAVNLWDVDKDEMLVYGIDKDFIIHDDDPNNPAGNNKMTFDKDGSLDDFHIELTDDDYYYGEELELELLFEAVNESIFSDRFTIVKTE